MFRMGKTPAHEGLTPPPISERKRRKKEVKREGKLVIVESPAKARTVGRILGKEYKVEASVGHVRDLLRSQLSVDVDNNFTPKYRIPNEKRPVVKELKALADKAKEIYLATDPDREGEAIAWHLEEALEVDPELTKRVVFHEITRPAIEEAFERPRELNMNLVDAQQARRVLDRLVGYSISPILWRKVRNRLSAGRVQSVALRLVVEREEEIENFVPVEYWSIEAEMKPDGAEETFITKLARIDDEKPELGSEEIVKPILTDMEVAKYVVSKIKRGQRKRKPPAPFTTSTLQQDASRKLRFTARKTMAVAQQLYEGIDPGDGKVVGLITYMRTDSTKVAETAQKEAREYIIGEHGKEYVPEELPKHKTKAKRAEEAHEAIRPTSAMRTPKIIKEHLSRDQYRLYQLIWQRFLASQMSNALYDTLRIDITGMTQEHEYLLRVSGSALLFKGYLKVYEESKARNGDKENGDMADIPTDLEEGQMQELLRLLPEQHFTEPPPRYSEASLVRALEENGIGRPSTYAPTMGTLQNRGYVYREGRRLHPTETGVIVNELITEYFPNIVSIGFTANMEDNLDKIAAGEQAWEGIIQEFWGPFTDQVEHAEAEMPEVKAEPEYIGRECPKCGRELMVRYGRYGKFISCSGFPECRHTEPWLEKIGVTCPLDGGDMVERRTRKGRIFYGCANYPECEFTSWKKPIPTPCLNCRGTLVIANKNFARCLDCEEQYPLDEVLSVEEAEKEII
jgi:DNA topoisomerase-1